MYERQANEHASRMAAGLNTKNPEPLPMAMHGTLAIVYALLAIARELATANKYK